MSTRSKHLLNAPEALAAEGTWSHPWNPQSAVASVFLGRLLGMRRAGVNIARVPPGKESFLPHRHEREEEWLYIMSGRGVAEIDGESIEVAAGDFMAFPAPSVVHHLRNPFDADLVYLMGGENLEHEIEDFPAVGKRVVRCVDRIEVYNLADARPFGESTGSG
jgi:uncharacterized cupin superfamily protein